MDLTLTERETEILRDILENHLPELRREVARTEQQELRRAIAERRDLVERLLARLGARAA
jgi:hypothetical protein